MFQEIKQTRRSLRESLPGRATGAAGPGGDFDAALLARSSARAPRASRRGLWRVLLAVVVLVLILGAASMVFSGAEVTLTPKTYPLTLAADTSIGYGPVKLMALPPLSESRTLAASGVEAVSERARGRVLIYNNFGAEAQRLVANTRLAAPDGKIYRLVNAVTVPGQKTVSGQKTPGSVETEVVADAPGESYNRGPTDFTIPGFKGGPRYEKFYARSVGSIEGGAVTERPAVKAAERASAEATLRGSLLARALTQARAQVPDGVLIFPEATAVDFVSELKTAPGGGKQATLTGRLNFQAILFDRQLLTTKLLAVGQAPGATVWLIPDLSAVKITLAADAWSEDLASAATVNLRASGRALAVAAPDEEKIKTALAGRSRAEGEAALAQFPEIQAAEISFRLPWRRSFPNQPEAIRLTVLTP